MILPKEDRKIYDFADRNIVPYKLILFISKSLFSIFIIYLIYVDRITKLTIASYICFLLLPWSSIILAKMIELIIAISIIIIKNIIKLFKKPKSNTTKTLK